MLEVSNVSLVMNKAEILLELKEDENAAQAGTRIVDAIEEIGFEASVKTAREINGKVGEEETCDETIDSSRR